MILRASLLSVTSDVEWARTLHRWMTVHRCSECRSEQQIGFKKDVPTTPFAVAADRHPPYSRLLIKPRPRRGKRLICNQQAAASHKTRRPYVSTPRIANQKRGVKRPLSSIHLAIRFSFLSCSLLFSFVLSLYRSCWQTSERHRRNGKRGFRKDLFPGAAKIGP